LHKHNPNITHVLAFLDDFILQKRVNNKKIISVVEEASEKDMAYLRFKPLEEGILGTIRLRLTKGLYVGVERCSEFILIDRL